MKRARWIEIDASTPQAFHDTYRYAAEAQPINAAPMIFWGVPAPHICLGLHQSRAAELSPTCSVAVARRALGGGAVWLDRSQYCFVIVGAANDWGAPRDWFARGLAPLIETYRGFGLAVARQGRDAWLDGKKIAGSGAATIGHGAVFASSFLLRFDAQSFLDAIDCPSAEYRDMLRVALQTGMTSWAAHVEPPAQMDIKERFRQAVAESFQWSIEDDALLDHEHASLCGADDDSETENSPRAKTVRDGIKINDATFLLQQRYAEASLTLLKSGQFLMDVCIPGIISSSLRSRVGNALLSVASLQKTLAQELDAEAARLWAERIVKLAEGQAEHG